MKKKNATLRKGLVLGTVAGSMAAGLVGVTGVGTASADASLKYTCTYPLIGDRSLTIDIKTSLPDKIGTRQPTGDMIQTQWEATLGADTTEGLRAIDAVTIEGKATTPVKMVSPDSPSGFNVQVNNAMEKTPIPESGAFKIKGYGQASRVAFQKTGKATFTMGELDLRITTRKQNGDPTALGTFSSKCTPVSGQDLTVDTLDIVEEQQTLPAPFPVPGYWPPQDPGYGTGTLNYGFDLKGTSQIKTSNGTVNLTGGINVAVDGGTGDITGDLMLNKVKDADMKPLGFLPIKVDVDFEQVGKTVGKYANGEINTTSTMYIKLPKVALFGLPISMQPNCRTKEPSVIKMNSPAGQFFNPKAGGKLNAPNYTISPLENCGFLTAIISPLTAGSGNTIDLTLTPKS